MEKMKALSPELCQDFSAQLKPSIVHCCDLHMKSLADSDSTRLLGSKKAGSVHCKPVKIESEFTIEKRYSSNQNY